MPKNSKIYNYSQTTWNKGSSSGKTGPGTSYRKKGTFGK